MAGGAENGMSAVFISSDAAQRACRLVAKYRGLMSRWCVLTGNVAGPREDAAEADIEKFEKHLSELDERRRAEQGDRNGAPTKGREI